MEKELTKKEKKELWNNIPDHPIKIKTISVSEAIEQFEDNLTIEEINKLRKEHE